MTLQSGQGYYYAQTSPAVTRGNGKHSTASHRPPNRARTRRLALAQHYYKRPPLIRQAINSVELLLADADLSETDLRVLVAILATCTDKDDPSKAMFAKKATIAKQAGCSPATFYRSYAKLRQCGIIVTCDQQRYDDGSLGVTTFYLGSEAASKLGLTCTPNDGAGDPPGTCDRIDDSARQAPSQAAIVAGQSGHGLPGMRDGLRVGPIKGFTVVVNETHQSYGKQSVQSSADDPPARFISRGGKAIPTELVELIDEHGIHPTGVLHLMRLAKQAAGHRFSDIYGSVRTTIDNKRLTGNARYAYLRTCAMDTQRDWTKLAEANAKATRAAIDRRVHQDRSWAMVGSWYLASGTGARWRVVLIDNRPVFECLDRNASIVLNDGTLPQILKDIDAGVLQALLPGEEGG